MEWTTTRPTEPGAYWLRRDGYETEVLVLVHGSHNNLEVNCQGDENLRHYKGEWYGPLEVPHG